MRVIGRYKSKHKKTGAFAVFNYYEDGSIVRLLSNNDGKFSERKITPEGIKRNYEPLRPTKDQFKFNLEKLVHEVRDLLILRVLPEDIKFVEHVEERLNATSIAIEILQQGIKDAKKSGKFE